MNLYNYECLVLSLSSSQESVGTRLVSLCVLQSGTCKFKLHTVLYAYLNFHFSFMVQTIVNIVAIVRQGSTQ